MVISKNMTTLCDCIVLPCKVLLFPLLCICSHFKHVSTLGRAGGEEVKHHTLSSGTSLYRPYKGVPPPPRVCTNHRPLVHQHN